MWYTIEPSHSFDVCFHARVVIEMWHSFGARVFHARMLLPAWHSFAVSILQKIVCIGNNHNSDGNTGNNLNQYYYLMAVNLGKRSRWFQVRKYLEDNNGATLLLISILTILMVAKCCDECKGKWLGAVKNSSKGTIYRRRYFARPYIYIAFS